MRKVLLTLAFAGLLPTQAFAQRLYPEEPAPQMIGALSNMTSMGSQAYEGMLHFELADWKDNATHTSARLVSGCGVAAEARVVGFPERNMLLFLIKNTTDKPIEFFADEISVEFSTSLRHNPQYDFAQGKVLLEPGKVVYGAVPLQDKYDFKEAQWFKADFPFATTPTATAPDQKPCMLTARIERNLSVPLLEESYLQRTQWEFGAAFGTTALRLGPVSQLGVPAVTLSFFSDVYFSQRHGVFFRIFWENFGGGNQTVFTPIQGGYSGSPTLQAISFSAGYSHRIRLGERWFVYAQGGLGIYGYLYTEWNASGVTVRTRSDQFTIDLQGAIAYRWLNIGRGLFRGSYFVDLTLFNRTLPFAAIETLGANGNVTGALVSFRWGR